MRIAALAFGVLAGLVASLVLALGGLDPGVLRGVDGRQLQLLSFGLFVIANFGVLGAGIALASPLIGAVLLVIGALAWLVAGLLLHHGPDFVLLTPPGLLLVATAFALIGWMRRDREPALEPQRRPAPRYEDEEEEDDPRIAPRVAEPALDEDTDDSEPQRVPVNAGFFGQGGTAMPARVEAGRPPQPALRDDRDSLRQTRTESWRPGSRRPPPRQKPMFRQPEDDDEEEEESGWSRLFRGASSVLSFGLYAALAGAAVLIVLNLRAGDTARPAAAKIDATTSVATAPALSSSEPTAPVLAAPPSEPRSPMLAAPVGSITGAAKLPKFSEEPPPTQQQAALTTPSPDDALLNGVVVAPDPNAPALVPDRLTPQGGLQPGEEPQGDATSDLATAGAAQPTAGTTAQPMPFAMPAAIAAARTKPAAAPRRNTVTTTAPAREADTGI